MRRTFPILITVVVGWVLIVADFIPHKPFGNLGDDFALYFDIIAVFAFILGGGNLFRIHLTKVQKKKKDWPFSIVTLGGFIVMLAAGLFKIGNPGGIQGDVAAVGSLFNDMYMQIFTPLQASMFALLAFFVGSASYRAFRAKTTEATILLIAAFIVLLGRTPFGLWLTSGLTGDMSFLQLPNLTDW
ncbi:MAG: hypothetical protein KAT85_02205, partial [candidate division Zixibacteria bacterium]|nr:hypothetical protein [candidate division Zixibacteria bacterium]